MVPSCPLGITRGILKKRIIFHLINLYGLLFDQDGWILTPFVGKFTLERTRLIDNVNPLLMPKVTAYIAIYEQSESCVDSSLLKTRLYCICMTI